jgi:predicted Zn-ribbon and HTH transcriptional regulator
MSATENTERLTPDEYTEDHGAFCPACQSNEIEGGAFEADANCAWQHVRCRSCGAEWNDTYELTGYANLRLRNTNE